MDQLSLIEAVHFLAFISMPRGTAPRDCPEGLGVSFVVVDGLRGIVGRSQSGDDADADAGGGGADAAASDVEVPKDTPSASGQSLGAVPRGSAPIEIKAKKCTASIKVSWSILYCFVHQRVSACQE